ncbi:protein SPT2 homolog [Synchiropus splendidus]|uniref:protein SPT2 homolog n=1 Tax=Synchiropus splendidus TaxID=270530 RepID=UPI00237DA6EB|nr:protein SPT2 homolog [Synchiropus splendidus]
MMDFDNVLNLASQNQGGGSTKKRYSLQVAPPKKDPRAKVVNPNAVQALLKKRQLETRQKEMEIKKQKEELLAKRVELKSDRKARAMASRTKDNFHGYNGVPFVEPPKKRRSKQDMEEDEHSMANGRFRNYAVEAEDDEDNYEYEPSDSEPEPEPVQRPGKPSAKKPNGTQKSAAPSMNFADLLKLAEKKQFEPVDLKRKVVKQEERLRTADEIREHEMEQKARRRDKDPRTERDKDSRPSSASARKGNAEKEHNNVKPQKGSSERPGQISGSGKKSSSAPSNDKTHVSSKPLSRDREGLKARQGDKERPKTSMSSSSGGMTKLPLKTSLSQVSAKQSPVRTSSGHKSSEVKKNGLPSPKGRAANATGSRPSSGQRPEVGSSKQQRPSQASSVRQVPAAPTGKGQLVRSGGSTSGLKPSSAGPLKAGSSQQARPRDPAKSSLARPGGSSSQAAAHGPPGRANSAGGSLAGRPPGVAGSGPGRPMGAAGSGPGRPSGRQTSGPGRPTGSQGNGMGRPTGSVGPGRPMGSSAAGLGRSKCTVMSETISSKNVGGPRPGGPLRPGMQQRPGMGPRPPGPMNRPPGTMLPPITSAYKRKYEDDEDEYDPEMDDFIDDVEDEQEEVSKHIREIFGYDRNRYKNESDYALKFMESSWKDMQREEARSLKLAVQEDLEEERKEEEEMKRKNAKRKRRN